MIFLDFKGPMASITGLLSSKQKFMIENSALQVPLKIHYNCYITPEKIYIITTLASFPD